MRRFFIFEQHDVRASCHHQPMYGITRFFGYRIRCGDRNRIPERKAALAIQSAEYEKLMRDLNDKTVSVYYYW